MSTPQWFAEFERQEAMRQDRLDTIRAQTEEWRARMAEQARDMDELDRAHDREVRRKALEEAAWECDRMADAYRKATYHGSLFSANAARSLADRIRALIYRESSDGQSSARRP